MVLPVVVLLAVAVPGGTQPTTTTAEVSPVAARSASTLADRAAFGAFVEGMQADPSQLAKFEQTLGAGLDIASYYYGFGDVFPTDIERSFSGEGTRKVLLSWDMGPTRFAEWSSGKHDAYLDQIAAAASSYPYDVYVRPWPEMNGDWQEFQPTADGSRRYAGTFAEFRSAWQHVVTYLRDRGATNLKWVFNPTTDTYAETTHVNKIWPGAAYVDVLGLDGFNWGQDSSWGRWLSFRSIFAEQYKRLTALHPTAPVWLCEVSSKEPKVNDGAPVDQSHRKADWVRAMMADTSMPRIRAVIWFQALKERDWRVTSSRGVVKALQPILR